MGVHVLEMVGKFSGMDPASVVWKQSTFLFTGNKNQGSHKTINHHILGRILIENKI